MPAYMISYDLRKVRNYGGLLKVLNDLGCIRPLKSLWFGQLRGNSVDLRNTLSPFIDGDDGLVIVEVKPTLDWAFLKVDDSRSADWFKNNLGSSA